METHSDTTTIDGPTTVENVPEQPMEAGDTSFFEAIENALNPPAESVETQTEETTTEEPELKPEETQTEDPPLADKEESSEPETKEEGSEEKDPLDTLTEEVGDEWTPKAANRFKQLKTELKSNRSELEQLQQTVKEQEKQISEMKGLTESEDMAQMKEKIEEYERVQAFENLEQTEAYTKSVTEPLDKVFTTLNELAEKYDVDPDNILDALDKETSEEQDESISELFYGATDRDKVRVFRAVEDIEPILQKREDLHNNAEEALAEANALQEERQNAIAAEELKHRQAVTQNVIDKVWQKLPFLNGLEGVDQNVIKEKAYSQSPDVVHPVDYAYNSVAAQLLPTIVKEYFQTMKENDSLTDRLAEFEAAEPTVSGQASSNKPDTDLDFASAIEAALGGN